MKKAIEYVKRELRDLDIAEGSAAWTDVYENAIEASDIMSRKELRKYIEERVELLPLAARG